MARNVFQDIRMKMQNMTAHVRLGKYGPRADAAQRWLEAEIVRKMLPIMPRKTGNLLGEVQSINSVMNGSGKVRAAQKYGVYLYSGTTKDGRPFNWTNPQTQPRWGHYVLTTYRPELVQGVNDILKGKGAPNGGAK